MRSSLFKRGAMFMGSRSQAGDGNACMAQFAGVAYIPAFQSVSGNLGMKLQTECVIAYGKSLIGIGRCFC